LAFKLIVSPGITISVPSGKETSPVISVNMPDMLDPETLRIVTGGKPGSVGQGLPGTVIRIADPETLEELPSGTDGLIMVSGVQVMKGYLHDPEKTSEVIAEIDGIRYYKTGDKGHLDDDGFITIIDRYSRFAKIGGEMISLAAVEEQTGAVLGNEVEITAVSLPDEKKGEKIVLLYSGGMTVEEIKNRIGNSAIAPLMRPSNIFKLKELPKLASGKTDFKGAKKAAGSLLSEKTKQ
jgi:acyl-[acyl-carrier-protein]-phospholipid O-acyltransferase/long-chain-fatty-acid--[acyl-carrier-protein] ligase